MRTPLILGNWKMHKTAEETRAFFRDFLPRVAEIEGIEVGIAPPFTALQAAAKELGASRVLLGAQNCHWEKSGAFTGEISATMLKEAGCGFAIVGHSERRQYFGESDETVGRRAAAALAAELLPVICVGETLEEREAGREGEVVERQLVAALEPLGPGARIAVAYEPVWAIGTGKTATAEEAWRMHALLRTLLAERWGTQNAKAVRILYGGSVKPENARELLGQENVDGALVGGASLDAETFASIARYRV